MPGPAIDIIKYKWVRIISPGGVAVNYQGQTGFTYRDVVLSTDMIKKFLDQKAIVIELGDEEGTEIRLTEDNYNTDNGGLEVDETKDPIVEDIEDIHAEAREAKQEARITKIGEEYKKYFEKNASRNITALSIDIDEDTISAYDTSLWNAKIPGTTIATLDDGSEVELKLDWDVSEVVMYKAGVYDIVGTPILTKGISNTNNFTVSFTLTLDGSISGGGGSVEPITGGDDDENEF